MFSHLRQSSAVCHPYEIVDVKQVFTWHYFELHRAIAARRVVVVRRDRAVSMEASFVSYVLQGLFAKGIHRADVVEALRRGRASSFRCRRRSVAMRR
jgi:hypothetical protein